MMNLRNIVGATCITIACSLGLSATATASPITHNPIASPAEDLVSEIGIKVKRGYYKRHGIFFHNGHRGYRHYRHGYHKYRGHYFPRRAFSAHIYIGPRYIRPHYIRPGYIRPRYKRPTIVHINSRHVHWCHAKYRSYRASDNTFQPYHGPRKRCSSPYGR